VKIGLNWLEDGMRKWEVILSRALSRGEWDGSPIKDVGDDGVEAIIRDNVLG